MLTLDLQIQFKPMFFIRFTSLLAFCFFITACTHKVDGVIVDEELVPFYESFAEEAAKRGIVFDNAEEQIEGYIQSIASDGVLGACRRNEDNDDSPQIFLDKPYWKTATTLEKEYVMFHELGHCFLKLGHDDSEDDVGNCISIMASGLGGCRVNYNPTSRDELIDELFSK
jgi:hypothetical protein